MRPVERNHVQRRVQRMDRGVVTEADERNRLSLLATQVEPMDYARGAIAAAQCPNPVDRRIIKRGLQVREPLRVRTCKETVARSLRAELCVLLQHMAVGVDDGIARLHQFSPLRSRGALPL